MKKLKISSLSPAPLMIIMAIATLIAVPLRTFQLTNCIEPATGFWLVKDFTVPLLYILCGVIIALAFFISLFSGIMERPHFDDEKNIPLAVFASLFGVSFAVDSVLQLSNFLSIFSNFAEDGTMTMGAYIVKSGCLACGLQVIFGFLSAVYMIMVGVSYFKGTGMFKKMSVLALAPPVWAMARMAFHFIDPINYKNVSGLLFQLIMLVFVILFTFSFARIASNVNGESSMWLLWFSGISGAFVGFISGLAPLILVVIGKGDLLPIKYPMRYTDLAFALFAVYFLFTVMPRTIKTRTDK